ncbi:hypothetical protein [Marinobacter sp. X15-166B]|uniref:hypothetical protein n=1 Tax=Marinobacter sp. X15-166B TaxID=1897620 RepID=UPI001300DF03|nr:hypothetical protein [Marinobacter sp. X15-166B]
MAQRPVETRPQGGVPTWTAVTLSPASATVVSVKRLPGVLSGPHLELTGILAPRG